MGGFFSKKKAPSRVTEHDKAVLQLKHARDKVKQYHKRVDESIAKERVIAKKLIQNGQKDRALLLLRKKKFQEQLVTKADGQLENLERMVHDLEFAQVEIQVIDGLKTGNVALKQLQEILSIDDIEKVMDETREGIEKQNELNELLSGTLSDEDNVEIEAELDALLAKEIEEKVPEVPEEVLLPEVPEEEPEKEKTSASKKKVHQPVALEA